VLKCLKRGSTLAVQLGDIWQHVSVWLAGWLGGWVVWGG